jgi:urease accessory protein UreH
MLASATIYRRNWRRHLRIEWHVPGRHRAGETFTAGSRASNASAHEDQTMSKLDDGKKPTDDDMVNAQWTP